MKISFDFSGIKHEIEHHEGGGPLAGLAIFFAVVGFIFYQVNKEAFESLYHPLYVWIFESPAGLTLFFALMSISIKMTVKEKGLKAMAVIGIFATLGALGPMVSYTGLNILTGSQFSPEGAIVPTATHVVYSRTGLVIAGADPSLVRMVGQIGVVDDGIGMVLITFVELEHAFSHGEGSEFIQGLMIAAISIASALAMSYFIRVWIKSHKNPDLRHNLVFIIPALIIWYALFNAGLHTVLAFVPIIFFIPEMHLRKIEIYLVYSMFLIIPVFAFMTAAVDPGNFGILAVIILVSLYAFKFFAVGLIPMIVNESMDVPSLREFTRGEFILMGFMSGIGFKVAGLAALLVFREHELGEALLATNLSAVIGFAIATVFRFAPLFGFKWGRQHTEKDIDLHGV